MQGRCWRFKEREDGMKYSLGKKEENEWSREMMDDASRQPTPTSV